MPSGVNDPRREVEDPVRAGAERQLAQPTSVFPARLRVAVLMGGANSERFTSLSSGAAIVAALRLVGHLVATVDSARSPAAREEPERAFLPAGADEVVPEATRPSTVATPPDLEALVQVRAQQEEGVLASGLLPILEAADVVFVTVFGDEGESGRTQRFLERRGIVYTGPAPDVCEFAFDKVRTKVAVTAKGVDTPAWQVVRRAHIEHDLEGLAVPGPWIVKPVAGGSTIGLSKVNHADRLAAACERASAERRDVLIETFVEGRDFTIGALGDCIFEPVELVTAREVFDYAAKYTPGMARKEVPANLSPWQSGEIRRLAGIVHRSLGIGDATSRADFRLAEDGRFMFLETNPLPGMMEQSSYPLSVGAGGIAFPELCEQIILRALQRAGRPAPNPIRDV